MVLAGGHRLVRQEVLALKLRFLGHATWYVEAGGVRAVIDPFLRGNPRAAATPEELRVDCVLVTHAHDDHKADAVEIARRNDALLISTFEIAAWAAEQGARTHGMHLGGRHRLGDGYVRVVPAYHGSGIAGGHAAGFVLHLGGVSFYHAGDTSLFGDMRLLGGTIERVDVAALPIGDNFTMGIDDAVIAVEWIRPRIAVPMHYGTFPAIDVDPGEFQRKVAERGLPTEVRILSPGEELVVSPAAAPGAAS